MKEIDLYNENLEKEILALPFSNSIDENGPQVFIPESDYGFAHIYRFYDDILCFLIPTYGGTPSFYKCVGRHSVAYLIKELREMN